jgi:Copper type II ascorbate-dependent monooxygenase, C-terminal domain
MRNIAIKAFWALLPLAIVACSSAAPTEPGFPGLGADDTADAGSGSDQAAPSSGSTSGSTTTDPSSGSSDNTAMAQSGTASSGAPIVDAAAAPEASSASGTMDQIQTVDIPVAPNAEMVKCQNFKNPFGKDVAILESNSDMVSSHHMFVFHDPSFNADTNSVADCSGIEFHDLLHMSQTPSGDIVYPPGVGRVLKATDGLRVLVHLLNPGTTMLTARVTVKFRVVAPTDVGTHAVSLFFNNAVLSVPVGKSTQSRTFSIPNDIKIMLAVSHMHSRATSFSAMTTTGQVIYQGTDWNEPVPTKYDPAMDVAKGSIVTWSCTYNNMTGKTLTFGESANTNEMCILAGVAYPKTPGVELGTTLESVL